MDPFIGSALIPSQIKAAKANADLARSNADLAQLKVDEEGEGGTEETEAAGPAKAPIAEGDIPASTRPCFCNKGVS